MGNLVGSPQDRSELETLGKSTGAWRGAGQIGTGLVMLSLAWWFANVTKRSARSRAYAQVLSVHCPQRNYCLADLQYTTQSGEAVLAQGVPLEGWWTVKPGDRLWISYDPESTQAVTAVTSGAAAAEDKHSRQFLSVYGWVIAAFGIYSIAKGAYLVWAQNRYGVAARIGSAGFFWQGS